MLKHVMLVIPRRLSWNPNLLLRITLKLGSNLPERLLLLLGKYHIESFIREVYDKNNKRYSACHYFLFIYTFYPIKHITVIQQVG